MVARWLLGCSGWLLGVARVARVFWVVARLLGVARVFWVVARVLLWLLGGSGWLLGVARVFWVVAGGC